MCPYMNGNCPYFSQGQCPYGYNPYYEDNIQNNDLTRSEEPEENLDEAEEAVNPEGVYMPAPFSIEVQNPYPGMDNQQYPGMDNQQYPGAPGMHGNPEGKYPDMHGNINIPQGPPPMQGQPPKPHGPSAKAVDPGAIRRCRYRYVYIWPRRGRGFWAYLTYVGRTSVAGFRWNGRRWVYFGMDLRQIESFQCF